jgi:hypothetical protein
MTEHNTRVSDEHSQSEDRESGLSAQHASAVPAGQTPLPLRTDREIEVLQVQLASLRKALEWIADPELWPEQWHGDERFPTWIGSSHPFDIARSALSTQAGEGE